MGDLTESDVERLENAYPLFRDTNFPGKVYEIENRVVVEHPSVIAPGSISGPPGQLPDVAASGATTYMVFDGLAGAEAGYSRFKIPYRATGDFACHIHWTKTDDVDRNGEVVRWVVAYNIHDGRSEDAGTESVLTIDDTYDDSGTTTRVVFRSPNGAFVGFAAGAYISIRVEKGTPGAGVVMAAPGLVSLDLTYSYLANRENGSASQ